MIARFNLKQLQYAGAAALLTTAYSSYALSTPASCSEQPQQDRLQRWRGRWSEGKTGWHLPKVHHALKDYADSRLLAGHTAARVLVPLCGKTMDMPYFAAKEAVQAVVGVEGARQGLEEFVKENPQLNIKIPQEEKAPGAPGFEKWSGDAITLLLGDYFSLDEKATGGKFDVSWDRGALVAIQPPLREEYVELYGRLMAPGGRIFLSAYVRENGDLTTGPPFSVPEKEVRRLFEGQPWVESVELVRSYGMLESYGWMTPFVYWRLGSIKEHMFIITVKKE